MGIGAAYGGPQAHRHEGHAVYADLRRHHVQRQTQNLVKDSLIGNIYRQTVDELEVLVRELDADFQHPLPVPHGIDSFVFRHDARQRSDILASYLKAVRIVSLLNASLCLIEKGYVQELNILCRAIDEACEDITFLARSLGETGTSEHQRTMIQEFFQEEFESPDNFLSSTTRKRVSRRKIRATFSNAPIGMSDPHTMLKTAESINNIYSGFVHGSYVSIIEMYDDRTREYHMRGMLKSPHWSDHKENFSNHLYRSILAVAILSSRTSRKDIAGRAVNLQLELAQKTGCLDDEGIQNLRRGFTSQH
jgi:hypothetical protein